MNEYSENISVNEKLKSFTDMALREAYRKKKEIIENTEKEIEATLKAKEIELLEEAYRNIQTGTRENSKELNESVSKALVDGKRMMFNKRKEIILDVFKEVRKKLEVYKTTPEYPIKMLHDIFEGFSIINDSYYEIEVNESEIELFKKIITEAKLPIEIKASENNIFGGFIMNGLTRRMRVDCSFASAELEAREKFLEITKISIDDGDLLDAK